MISKDDFSKKQIVVVFCNDGERISISNENMVVKTEDGKVKLQCSCYRLFLVFLVGNCSLTTALLQRANKFGFFIALMTTSFRLYSLIGAGKEGNTLLRRKQYTYKEISVAKHIIENKISNQREILKRVREKSDALKEAIGLLENYEGQIQTTESVQEIMAYEGLSSKLYFQNHFNNVAWRGRQPRIKRDYVNSTLDIGYTLLFSFIDALLSCFGFDNYCGFLHTQFYMRKSLVCDMVEPFRPIIDSAVKKGINYRQIQPEDFTEFRGQYQLDWKQNSKYVKLFLSAIMERKEDIFLYIQAFYRAFMKDLPAAEYPYFDIEV